MSLFDAVTAGDRAALAAQLDAGADPNPFDADGRTPLMAAARVGREDLVRLLLEAGADPTLPDNLGETPFVTAAAYGHVKVCALLSSKATDDEKDLARTLLANQGLTELPSRPSEIAPDDFRRKLASASAYVVGKLGDDGATKRLERVLRSEKGSDKGRK
ncbi:ankyrin repeat domain-containing protein [Corallococcus sp. bb12-1]|uniref:Ankyrin repeat domain-containing protein n=1 Tax=Corallococcus terminator TaxID=2316733 RepID=A0A3A8JP23_9BACT|nr:MULTISPECIES: ankyrin repeat domain-containing protein [Corallococcus]MCY1040590.1 ankyrin repeat domain-containing protein [Corallococcus sp. bb12-1]RKG94104.1 ankyrin repeat domain-containing protein [Corallococcus terminator]